MGIWFRRFTSRLTAADIDLLVELTIHDGVMPVLKKNARFNWHANLILEPLLHPGILRVLGRHLFGRGGVSAANAPIR